MDKKNHYGFANALEITTFDERLPLVEDTLRWKTTFGRRQPLVEDSLWWTTTFGGDSSPGQSQHN